MKVVIPDSKYAVTFNGHLATFEVGESDMGTIDYIGDDVRELANEVILSDPLYPMVFLTVEELPEDLLDPTDLDWAKNQCGVLGLFFPANEPIEYPVAILTVR